MKKFRACVVCLLVTVAFLATIAGLQYGYYNGPEWLFRFQSKEGPLASLFCVLSGFVVGFFAMVSGACAIVNAWSKDDHS